VGRFAACLKALGNPELRDAMGKASRKRYEQFFSIETMVEAVKQAYRHALPTGKPSLAQQEELLDSGQ
jgi:glycosyltransferase involved in cell wall biosynthesis